jgi:glycosyltransferase involved in cell wall biosynthesis
VKILALEPYYGGSHKTFLNGVRNHLPFDFELLSLPARKWKWRMRLAAPYFAEKITARAKTDLPDIIFCSSFVDVAALRSLLPGPLQQIPIYCYFHENQFAYPVQREDERDFHFGLTNFTTILASDRAAFNTRYNLQTFLRGTEQMLKICADMKLAESPVSLQTKISILNPGVDFSRIDTAGKGRENKPGPPVLVWNHRWEHDKNPEFFFRTILDLEKAGADFRLIVLGQSFRRRPAIFSEAKKRLQPKILHWGFVDSRDEYAQLLQQGDIVVSTAGHEFYGIAVIEAVRAGCLPLLPKRLSYPELFPEEYLYEDNELFPRLKSLLKNPVNNDRQKLKELAARFSWDNLTQKYVAWFSSGRNP